MRNGGASQQTRKYLTPQLICSTLRGVLTLPRFEKYVVKSVLTYNKFKIRSMIFALHYSLFQKKNILRTVSINLWQCYKQYNGFLLFFV